MPILGVAPIQSPFKGETWYGREQIAFTIPISGNPYEADENDVRATFSGPGGKLVRLAYFDKGVWKANLSAAKPGMYRVTVTRNGHAVRAEFPGPSKVSLKGKIPPFVRIQKRDNRFVLSDGKPFWPIGHNLGWNSGTQTVEAQLGAMGARGLNWSRIWACAWDGKNPFFPTEGSIPKLGELNPAVLDRWDGIVSSAEKAGVRFQFVLFHHGLFSKTVNPNWGDHPWNTAKGGFLEDPARFFVDPQAIKLSRNWLRYAVARWGHSPAIMSWELFNEVEGTDAGIQNRVSEISRWHKSQFDYLRSIDPYHHLVTSSSEARLGVYAGADYYQPHGYPMSVEAMVRGVKVPGDKPFFYGEVGGAQYDAKTERDILRQSAWAGFFAGHAGASQYWYWDRVEGPGMYDELSRAAAFIKASGLAGMPQSKPQSLSVRTDLGGPLVFQPGLGWEANKTTSLKVPGSSLDAAGISSYFQGEGHRDMFPMPLRIAVDAPSAGKMAVKFGTIAKQGATIKVVVNGQVAFEKSEPPRSEDGGSLAFEAAYPQGKSTIEIWNTGPDWARLESISFDGLGSAIRAMAIGDGRKAALRIIRSTDWPAKGEIAGLKLADGSWNASVLDLDSGAKRVQKVELRGGKLNWTAQEKDVVILLARKP